VATKPLPVYPISRNKNKRKNETIQHLTEHETTVGKIRQPSKQTLLVPGLWSMLRYLLN
jgi:hypothetical protein